MSCNDANPSIPPAFNPVEYFADVLLLRKRGPVEAKPLTWFHWQLNCPLRTEISHLCH